MQDEPVLINDDVDMVPEYDFKRDKDIDIKVYPEVD